MTAPHHGRCLCGEVTYSISADPVGARICWCRDCQYIASGSPTVNVLFPESSVAISGPVTVLHRIADSGNDVERGFCPTCGSQIFSRTTKPAGAHPIRIRAGTLDNPDLCPPQAAIWVQSAPSWAYLDPTLPRHGKGPDSPQIGGA